MTHRVLQDAENGLTPLMRSLIDVLWGEWKTVAQQIEGLSDELQRIAASDAGCIRIQQIPGHRTCRRYGDRRRDRQRRRLSQGA
jgi:hypothetical protein